MNKWTVKFETYQGDVEVVTVTAFSKAHAVNMVFMGYSCKEIYWVKSAAEVSARQLLRN